MKKTLIAVLVSAFLSPAFAAEEKAPAAPAQDTNAALKEQRNKEFIEESHGSKGAKKKAKKGAKKSAKKAGSSSSDSSAGSK